MTIKNRTSIHLVGILAFIGQCLVSVNLVAMEPFGTVKFQQGASQLPLQSRSVSWGSFENGSDGEIGQEPVVTIRSLRSNVTFYQTIYDVEGLREMLKRKLSAQDKEMVFSGLSHRRMR